MRTLFPQSPRVEPMQYYQCVLALITALPAHAAGLVAFQRRKGRFARQTTTVFGPCHLAWLFAAPRLCARPGLSRSRSNLPYLTPVRSMFISVSHAC